jgi:hypothetical protein
MRHGVRVMPACFRYGNCATELYIGALFMP